MIKPENKDKFRETADDAQVLVNEFIVTVDEQAPAGEVGRVSR